MSDEAPLPEPAAVCDGGDLDCGSGLLLIIRKAMTPLEPGAVLEVRSRESSVREDLPAWCRMVGHAFLGLAPGEGRSTRYALRKKGAADPGLAADLDQARAHQWRVRVRWRSGMEARVTARNHQWTLGQPASFDTEDAAASALEHLLGALGGCLTVGFQWRCSKAGIAVRDLELSLRARADNILVFLGLEAEGEEGQPGLAAVEGKVYIDAEASQERLAELWSDTLARSPIAQTLLRPVPIAVEMSKV